MAVAWRWMMVAITTSALLAACHTELDVDDGVDFFEPDDAMDNLDLQGVYDCSERPDTGYRQGSAFGITVVSVDGRPVEKDTANAYIAMQAAAAAQGVSVRIVSGFRTMGEQQHLYGCYTNCNCNNCNLAARPGYSNHQSGHALDLNTSSGGVLNWLNANGARFGFSRTVPSESWHWEWWGNANTFAGPCGQPVGDQRCLNNPNFGSCAGTVVTRCSDANQVESGDCGAFGAGCSVAGPDGPHCVHPMCMIELGQENGSFCKPDSSVIGQCDFGQYTEANCGAFGATCAEDGATAHCVHFMCHANLDGGETGSFCVDGTEKIGTCTQGSYGEGDCAAFGASCSEAGGDAHCVHFMCLAALDGQEDGTGCFDGATLVSCALGTPTISDCGAVGGRCIADTNGARCDVGGAPDDVIDVDPTTEPTGGVDDTDTDATNTDASDTDTRDNEPVRRPGSDVIDLPPSVISCASTEDWSAWGPALAMLLVLRRRRR